MRAILAITALLALSGCMADSQPEQPAMYLSMANGGATLDPQTAASMISQYRQNNGLGGGGGGPPPVQGGGGPTTAVAHPHKPGPDAQGAPATPPTKS